MNYSLYISTLQSVHMQVLATTQEIKPSLTKTHFDSFFEILIFLGTI